MPARDPLILPDNLQNIDPYIPVRVFCHTSPTPVSPYCRSVSAASLSNHPDRSASSRPHQNPPASFQAVRSALSHEQPLADFPAPAEVPVSPLPSRPILPVPGVRFLPLRSPFWHPRYSLPLVRSVPPAHARHSVPAMPVWSPSPYSASYMLPHSAETRFPPDPSSDGMPPALLLQG